MVNPNKRISVKKGIKETGIEKINVLKLQGNPDDVLDYVAYLEIGTSSIAKYLLEAFESEFGTLKYGRIMIDSNDFEKLISGLKNKKEPISSIPIENMPIYDLIRNLEYLFNYQVKGNVVYELEFIF